MMQHPIAEGCCVLIACCNEHGSSLGFTKELRRT